MRQLSRNIRFMAAALALAFVSVSAQSATITTDGTTVSDDGIVYKSQYQGDVLTLSIFADDRSGALAQVNSLKQLTFSSMRPSGPGNSGFFLNSATMTGSSTQPGLACNGANGGGQICFFDMDDALLQGTPLTYSIAFNYSGPAIDFDDFNLRAIYIGQRLNASGTRLVNFQAGETVRMNATEVPEPSTLAMLGLGLGLASFARRRKTAAA